MKKILCFALTVILLCLSLVSCQPSEDMVKKADQLRVDVETLETAAKDLGDAGSAFKAKVVSLRQELDKLETKDLIDRYDEYAAKVAEMNKELEKLQVQKLVTLTSAKSNYVVIEVEEYGHIVIELYPDVAPITVQNFQNLVDKGFYDGLIFHRVVKGFCIQGGDPLGNGTGGSDETILGEFSSNGVANSLSHTRGVISMARSDDKNSASSQFFICHEDVSNQLDGKYAAFGKVIFGMETVDKIAAVDVYPNGALQDKPKIDVVIKSIRFATLNEQ